MAAFFNTLFLIWVSIGRKLFKPCYWQQGIVLFSLWSRNVVIENNAQESVYNISTSSRLTPFFSRSLRQSSHRSFQYIKYERLNTTHNNFPSSINHHEVHQLPCCLHPRDDCNCCPMVRSPRPTLVRFKPVPDFDLSSFNTNWSSLQRKARCPRSSWAHPRSRALVRTPSKIPLPPSRFLALFLILFTQLLFDIRIVPITIIF